ncbi:hypothetical protein AC579_6735 [Pseudocercospora musae]|uniref:Uncharacterized protein n=1 Tax=Pseudocercospora musae TaxID=113226 RepID=A0A139H9A3_9PEZI|nr:hypothetical protein AC579_6735 [Pseudocercospora musae]
MTYPIVSISSKRCDDRLDLIVRRFIDCVCSGIALNGIQNKLLRYHRRGILHQEVEGQVPGEVLSTTSSVRVGKLQHRLAES